MSVEQLELVLHPLKSSFGPIGGSKTHISTGGIIAHTLKVVDGRGTASPRARALRAQGPEPRPQESRRSGAFPQMGRDKGAV